jgi:hypothetical protein
VSKPSLQVNPWATLDLDLTWKEAARSARSGHFILVCVLFLGILDLVGFAGMWHGGRFRAKGPFETSMRQRSM